MQRPRTHIWAVCQLLWMTPMVIGLYGCKSKAPLSDPLADDATRQLIGMDHPYDAHPLEEADVRDLEASMAKRRLLGWQIAQKVFEPVAVPGSSDVSQSHMGLWQSWFTADEIVKMFEILYTALPADERSRAVGGADEKLVSDATIDCVLARYASEERLRRRHGAMFDARILNRIAQLKARPSRSISGVGRGMTLFNLPIVRHYLANYGKVIRCTKAVTDSYSGDTTVNFAPCFFKEFPSDAVAVKAIWARDDDPIDVFDTTAKGVKQALTGARVWAPATCAGAPCRIPENDASADPLMYTTRVQHADKSENNFRLTAMHIATKESRHWTWTTLWWSKQPGDDFGEDRPPWFGNYTEKGTGKDASMSELKNYKMCNTVGYREHDVRLLDRVKDFRVKDDDRSLEGAILSAYTHGNVHPKGGSNDDFLSWCSNPYIERDKDMADTNCVACHQEAGPDGDMAMTREPTRQIFPADYAWSFEFYIDMIAKDNDNFKDKFIAVAEDNYDGDMLSCPAP